MPEMVSSDMSPRQIRSLILLIEWREGGDNKGDSTVF